MKFNNLILELDDENFVYIHPDCTFVSSKISIRGRGNKVTILPSLIYNKLVIKLIGNKKDIYINSSVKNINNLKISSIRGDNQEVIIGEDFGVGSLEIQLNDGYEAVYIGRDCLFSSGIKMRTSDGHSVVDLKTDIAINNPKNIFIGNHVWVGEDVRFLKGAMIADDSVVGSAAVVTKSFNESNVVVAGFPAQIVKRGITWDRRKPADYNKNK